MTGVLEDELGDLLGGQHARPAIAESIGAGAAGAAESAFASSTTCTGHVSHSSGVGPGNLAQLAKGENTNAGREAVQFLGRNTPGGSLWYLRLAYERVLLDNLQRLVDPDAHAAFRRKVQMQRRDYGNQFFWAPGQSAPQRSPAFGGR